MTPPTGFSGSVVAVASASDGASTTFAVFQVTFPDTAPTVTVPDQTMNTGVNQIQVNVGATDPDTPADTLQYSARVSGFDAGYEAQLRLRFNTVPQGQFTVATGADPLGGQFQVKYLYSYEQAVYYYIRSNGELRLSTNNALDSIIGTQYYQNPLLLIYGPNAQPPVEPSAPSPAQLSVSPTTPSGSNVLTITRQAGFTGVFIIETTVFDGFLTTKKRFKVTLL
jgi:hypothetical protein